MVLFSFRKYIGQFVMKKNGKMNSMARDESKTLFIAGIIKLEFRNSQSQAVIRLIEEKDKNKRFIQNRRPLCLLNTDRKILLKVMA